MGSASQRSRTARVARAGDVCRHQCGVPPALLPELLHRFSFTCGNRPMTNNIIKDGWAPANGGGTHLRGKAKGSDVVLLLGGGSGASAELAWRLLIPALAWAGCRVYARPALRGTSVQMVCDTTGSREMRPTRRASKSVSPSSLEARTIEVPTSDGTMCWGAYHATHPKPCRASRPTT
jgi:hypothetical protein